MALKSNILQALHHWRLLLLTFMGAGSRQLPLKQCTVLPAACLYSSRNFPSSCISFHPSSLAHSPMPLATSAARACSCSRSTPRVRSFAATADSGMPAAAQDEASCCTARLSHACRSVAASDIVETAPKQRQVPAKFC
jgi:hypothetical protein